MKITFPNVIVGLDPTIQKSFFIHKPYGFWIPAFAGMTTIDESVYFRSNDS
jgi:hypothetical protein